MILTEENMKEKSISELIYFLTYPETFNKDSSLPIDLIYDYINKRLSKLKSYNKSKFNQFLLDEKSFCKMRGKDLKNYIFKCSLTINEILDIFLKLQQKHGVNQFYFLTFSEMIILTQVYEILYKLHKELLSVYERQFNSYGEDFSYLSEFKQTIPGEFLHYMTMENRMVYEYTSEKQLTTYYLNSFKELKKALYYRLQIDSFNDFDILEFDLREYMKAQKIINSEKRFIKSTRIGLFEEIDKLRDLTVRDLLDSPQLVRKYSINKY